MTIKSRARTTLEALHPKAICDPCLAWLLDKNTDQIVERLNSLNNENRVHRELGTCDRCGTGRMVTRATGNTHSTKGELE